MKFQPNPSIEMIPVDLSPLKDVVACYERIGAIEDPDVRKAALQAVRWITNPVGIYRDSEADGQ